MGIRVLYDSLSFDWERVGGVTRYFTKLWQNLPQGVEFDIAAVTTISNYLQQPPFNIPPGTDNFKKFLPSFNFKGKLFLFDSLCKLGLLHSAKETNRRCFAQKLKEGKYDIIHLTGAHSFGDVWRPYIGHKPIVLTVYDLIPDIVYGNKKIRRWREDALKSVTKIIAISNHTKDDIISQYGIPKDRISVIHLGAETGIDQKSVSELENKRYLLFVGKRDGYKNFSFMIKALAPIFAKDPSLSLVCTGSGFSEAEMRLLSECKMKERASARIYDEDELRWLFANAQVFIYPSIYEGFGIPILDAFSLGCPVLLANASCFPEVGGDAALYFDPQDADAFREQLMRVIGIDAETKRMRADLIARGKERAKMFSWQKCAAETAEIYRHLVKDPER